ncbi:hypothetical protein ACYATM_04020 [Lactobacillaceae bacterium Scapto_B20]
MHETFIILLIIFVIIFVITLLGALIQGIRIKNNSSKKWGISALVMAVLAMGSFWGVSASTPANNSTSDQTSQSSSDSNNSSSQSTSSATSSSSVDVSQSSKEKASEAKQRADTRHEQDFEARDRHRRDMENQRQESMLNRRGTDKPGYKKQISGVPNQSSHVIESVNYDGDKTVVKISTDLTMGNRRENEHNAFTVWSGIQRIAHLHHVQTDVVINDHKGKEIANTKDNQFNYLE